jgi:transglutaminase-like putative cysteine protease
MLLSIQHITEYQFDRPVHYALQRLKLRPKDGAGQAIHHWQLGIDGGKVEAEHDDPHNNHVTLISIEEGRTTITINCEGQVETEDNHGILGKHRSHVPLWAYCRPTRLTTAARGVQKLLVGIDRDASDKIGMLHELSAHILGAVEYRGGATNVDSSAEQAITAGAGVCQDHAHIFIAACRNIGIPARYVSGYLMMDGQIEQTASHAWAEAHLDHIGWVGFDISNGISPDGRYVRVATGFDYRDAAPVSGMSFGARDKSMVVSLRVEQ